jgi:hypothetical protein
MKDISSKKDSKQQNLVIIRLTLVNEVFWQHIDQFKGLPSIFQTELYRQIDEYVLFKCYHELYGNSG